MCRKTQDHDFKDLVCNPYFGLRWMDKEKKIYLRDNCLDTPYCSSSFKIILDLKMSTEKCVYFLHKWGAVSQHLGRCITLISVQKIFPYHYLHDIHQ